MKSATLRRYDDLLIPDERFRLALAAMARDDEDEVRRLHETCPRAAYTMPDHDFTVRWEASKVVAITFGAFWLWMQLRYTEAHWLVSAREHLAARGMTEIEADEAIDRLIRRGAELKGAHAGFVRFCAAARLDRDALLQWWPPLAEEIESVRWLLDDDDLFETDEEVSAATYRILAVRWPAPLTATGDMEDAR
jgi:hypothetical protein